MSELNFNEQHEYILKWFKQVVLGYMCRDIEKLVKVQVDEDGLGGCAASLAMTVFSTMDCLGYLTKKDNKELEDTERRIKDFCKEWMARVNEHAYGKSKTRDLLAELYRHGLAHQFISKSGTAITKETVASDVVGDDPKKGMYVLQVEILAKDLLETIYKHLKVYLENVNKKNLILRFYKRLLTRQQLDKSDLIRMREKLRKKQDGDYEIPIIEWVSYSRVPSETGTSEIATTSTTMTSTTTSRVAVTSVTTDPTHSIMS